MHKKSGQAPGGNKRNSGTGFKRDGQGGSAKPYRSKDGGKSGEKPFGKGGSARNSDDRPFRERGEQGDDKKRPFEKRTGDKPFRKEGGDSFKKTGEKSFKRSGDKSFGRSKPASDDGNAGTWERSKVTDDGRKPFPKRDKPFPKREGNKSYSGRVTGKPVEEYKQRPTKDIYDPLEIPEEKKNSRKAPVLKNDPSRAYKKETNEPISSRNGKKSADSSRTPKKRTVKSDEKRPYKKNTDDLTSDRPKPFDRKTIKPDEAHPDSFSVRKRHHHNHDDDDLEEEIESKGPESMPLNKYLAHSGICSRRDAAILIKEGKVKLNDEVVTDPGRKVQTGDSVFYNDKKLTPQKGMVYILLNKPKDYITTNDDPQGRKTVMDLLMGADAERLFPVGRLDRNTSGLLLITNDGDLTQKLAHPSFKVKKIYQVTLDKPLTKADFEKIVNGLELEDGIAHVDALAYLETKNELGIEIHIGKNRIVRRIFESLGYVVEKLDRVMYGNLTKKNLPRGKWRYLNEREIVLLKHFKS